MTKRNFLLLIIALVIVTTVVLGFLYFTKPDSGSPVDEGEGTNFFAEFNPFGSSKPNSSTEVETPADISGFEPSREENTATAQLVKVSSMPVAGFGIFNKERYKEISEITPPSTPESMSAPTPPPTELAGAVRYVDRITGNIYQTFADKISERRFSTTTIPTIYEAYFGNNAESVIMRYLKADGRTIQTFVGNLPKELLGADTSGENEITGSFLPENITDVSISPNSGKAFYLFSSDNSAIGTTYEFSTGKKNQVFTSSFTEWLSTWSNERMITLTTKPSSSVAGYAYRVDPTRKDFVKVVGNVNGLTALASPDTKLILLGGSAVSLSVFDDDSRSQRTLGAKTLPEKCVWGKSSDVIYCAVPKFVDTGEYPDAWYRGEVSFSDEIWRIDISSGAGTVIADPSAISGEEVDGIKLALDSGENYLFFMNKKDSFLWKLDLK